jgi:hypothetical protein
LLHRHNRMQADTRYRIVAHASIAE